MDALEAKPACVVLGASVAGLLTASVACRHFGSVTLVDKDDLTRARVENESIMETAKRRPGAAQTPQPHVLLLSGIENFDKLLPGIIDEMKGEGAAVVDLGTDVLTYDFGAPFAKGPTNMKGLCASRRLLEQCLRDRVLQEGRGRLHLRTGTKVAGLAWNQHKTEVVGVELASGKVVPADVVVDCSGRFSRTPRWLEEAGWQAPPVQRVDAHVVYNSRHFKRPQGWDKDWLAAFIQGRPYGHRSAIMFPIESECWQLVLYGHNGESAPSDDAGYLEYARSLPDTRLWEVLKDCQPVTPVLRFASTENIRHRYEGIPLPPGLLVVGDAAQALNPSYGQGMSVASFGALALNDALAAATAGCATDAQWQAALRAMGPAWQRRLAHVNAASWAMATAEDFRWEGTTAVGVSKPPVLLTGYIDALLRLAHTDLAAFEAFFSVAHMVKPFSTLFQPLLVLKVLWLLVKERLGWAPLPQPPQQPGPVVAPMALPAANSGGVAGSVGAGGGGGSGGSRRQGGKERNISAQALAPAMGGWAWAGRPSPHIPSSRAQRQPLRRVVQRTAGMGVATRMLAVV